MPIRVKVFCVVFLLVLMGALSIHAQAERDQMLVVVNSTQLGSASTTIALEEGFFADQNIDVELVEGLTSASSPEILALLTQGEIDVAQAQLTAGVFNAIYREAEIKIVAVASFNDPDTCAYTAFYVAPGQAENFDPESLRGANVAVGGGFTQYLLDRWLTGFGMSSDDVVIEDDLETPVRAESLANGRVSLINMSAPQSTRFEQEYGLEQIAGANEIAPNSSLAVLLFGASMLNREDDLAERFLTAYLQGARQFNEGQTERNLDILSEATSFDRELLAATCWISMKPDGQLDEPATLDYLDWMNEEGLLDTLPTVEDFYEPRYVEEAYTRLQALYPEMTATPAS